VVWHFESLFLGNSETRASPFPSVLDDQIELLFVTVLLPVIFFPTNTTLLLKSLLWLPKFIFIDDLFWLKQEAKCSLAESWHHRTLLESFNAT
jgi:hypothetical protein